MGHTIGLIITSAVGALIMTFLSGCGMSGAGFSVGTTSYLKEYNRAQLAEMRVRRSEHITELDRAKLESIIASRAN